MIADRGGIDPATVRAALGEAGLRATKSLSQNFLVDVDVLEAILREAEIRPGRRVLEIGPGLGILTAGLLGAGAAVVAIELDRGLIRRLRRDLQRALVIGAADRSAPGALTLVAGDALDVELGGLLTAPFEVVANLPYHITSPALHRLLGGSGGAPRPERLVLMVQREVAERVVAPPGGMSYLSVFVQYHAAARIARIVPPRAFEPAPAVDSAILILEVRTETERLPHDEEAALWRLVQAGFRERRKMIRNVLSRQLPLDPGRLERALATSRIDPMRRPQTLAVREWIELLAALGPIEAGR